MLRLWLIFAQAATIAVAALFVVSTFRPEWLPAHGTSTAALVQNAAPSASTLTRAGSYSDAVQRATPSVVNIFTSKEVRAQRHPLLNDPIFRRFFGDQLPDEAQRASSLGSGVIVSTSGYVVTNHHVVEAAAESEGALADGKQLLAKVVGNDPETDLAVLRASPEDLPPTIFAASETLGVADLGLPRRRPGGDAQPHRSGRPRTVGEGGGEAAGPRGRWLGDGRTPTEASNPRGIESTFQGGFMKLRISTALLSAAAFAGLSFGQE